MFNYINKKMSELSINGLIALGKYKEALELIERIIMNEKNSEILYNQKGICLKSLQDNKNAIQAFKEAIKINKTFRDAIINLAECESNEGNYLKSEKYYKKANSIKKLNRKETLSYVKILNKLGKHKQAIEFITNNPIISLDLIDSELQKTKIDLYLKTDNPTKALEILEKLEPILKNDLTLDLYKTDALLKQNNIEESYFLIERLRKKIPNSSYVKTLHSRLLIKQKKYNEALQIIKDNLELKPNNEKLINVNLNLLIKLEKYKEALVSLESFSSLISKITYLNYKSEIFLKMGKPKKAIEYNNKALEQENIPALTYVLSAEIMLEEFQNMNQKKMIEKAHITKDLELKLSTAIDNLNKAIHLTDDKELLENIYQLKNKIETFLN